jgi:large subunit ribosomal protein L23
MKNIIQKPLITEKATKLNDEGVYAFVVNKKATKPQIKDAIQSLYPDVTVQSVRTAIIIGKPKFRQTKSGISVGRTATYKKAFVQLAEGQFIDIYDAPAEQ